MPYVNMKSSHGKLQSERNTIKYGARLTASTMIPTTKSTIE